MRVVRSDPLGGRELLPLLWGRGVAMTRYPHDFWSGFVVAMFAAVFVWGAGFSVAWLLF